MSSRAIASLDAWLAGAEEVLAEQREHALSPSLGVLGGCERQECTITVADLSEGLEGVLSALCSRPGRWILIVESSARPDLFWQALAYEDGSLCTEVVSNTYLVGPARWTTEQEGRLLALGWDPPSMPKQPNFIHVEPTTSPEIDIECRRALATLRELFGLRDHDRVFVKMFSSARRENTAASPEYGVDTEDSSTFLAD